MRNNIRSTNLRFNLDKDLQRKAWQYLQTMDKGAFKSYSNAIALSVCDYFERYYHRKDDPYFETRQREEQFVEQIVNAVERSMEKTLPIFLAGLLSGMGQIPRTDAIVHTPVPEASAQQENGQAADEDVDWDFLGE